jgi:diacylglycerol kinase (ATP)
MAKNNGRTIKKVRFVVNPASGRPGPILSTLNEAFKNTGIDWDIALTKKSGDATDLAKAWLAEKIDLVGVYGGDGTLMEVISGMKDTEVPLGILPGGTGNVLATELGIPGDLKRACELLAKGPWKIRTIDVGQFNNRYFTQRASFGYESEMVKGARRKTKNRCGRLAYVLSSIDAVKKIKIAGYDIVVDGKKHHEEGVTCIVANCGNLGFSSRLTLDKAIDVADGLLDVLVVKKVRPALLKYLYKNITDGEPPEDRELVAHWQGKEIKVTSQPAQVVQCDGEILGKMAIHARIVPQAVKVVVPKKAGRHD